MDGLIGHPLFNKGRDGYIWSHFLLLPVRFAKAIISGKIDNKELRTRRTRLLAWLAAR